MVLFPLDDLRQVVETEKRTITKEKIDRQLAGQSSSTLFMSMKDISRSKRVIFNMQEWLEDEIKKLTAVISQLTTKGESVT